MSENERLAMKIERCEDIVMQERAARLASEPAKAPFVSRNEEWGLRPDFTTAGVTAPPAGAEVARLTALLHEANAVCLCGCPESEHESYGEDGESCGDDEHECIRVAPAVLAYVQDLRQKWADLGEDYEGLRAQINPPHPSWDTSCARCGRDLTVSSVTCGECCAEAPAIGAVVTPPGGAEVREAAEANDDCEVPGVCRACTPLVNEEISRWQARIEEVITRAGLLPYDASGNESGDPLDYSADQIEVALGASAALRGGQKGGA